ncbi:P1 family peptidase [Lacrimispora indolis]|uniref:P1 family peptidase n=1 Tax=Lacrimispora indolis TaxID=69825 RepID=UPI0003FCE054|nr:P1 family peptidase [[Clostridium] methoxybenzovorans]
MKRIREYGIITGKLAPGPLNKITDVEGVLVGHATINTKDHKTGVTVILPCKDNPFSRKLVAAAYIHNGFGKSQGLVQVEELGTLETPVALTNTLNVGKVHDALVDFMLEQCNKEGIEVTSINPVVGECNDSVLNKISDRVVGLEEVKAAVAEATADFEEGAIGAGCGTVCYGLKGGIGSASRRFQIGGETYTLGAIVQSNFGSTENLMVNGMAVGKEIFRLTEPSILDRGSVMTIVATDLPVTDRQLKRILKRAGVGLSRTGSYMGHGSGDIMVGFTTANRIPERPEKELMSISILKESALESAFIAAVEATEEAVLNSLAMAKTTTGHKGNIVRSLTDLWLSKDRP